MRGTRYVPRIKEEVLALGAKGATYSEIQKRFPIPKGTLSCWFHTAGISPRKDTDRMRANLIKAREASRLVLHRKRVERLELAKTKAQKAASLVALADMHFRKSLAAMLYWAEGTKSDKSVTVFTNTDPLLASLYLELLRSAFPFDESKLRVRLHLHHYHAHDESVQFWSTLLSIPKSQFGKIHVKKRNTQKRFRRNFQGTCFIVYHDVSVRRELMELGRLLADKITTQKLPSFNG